MFDSEAAAPETGPLAAAVAPEFAEPEFAAVATEFPDLRFSNFSRVDR